MSDGTTPFIVDPEDALIVAQGPGIAAPASQDVLIPTKPTSDKKSPLSAYFDEWLAKLSDEQKQYWNNFNNALAAVHGNNLRKATADQGGNYPPEYQRLSLFEKIEGFGVENNVVQIKPHGSNGFLQIDSKGVRFQPANNKPKQDITFAEAQIIVAHFAQNAAWTKGELTGTKQQRRMMELAIEEQNKLLPADQQIKIANPLSPLTRPRLKPPSSFAEFMPPVPVVTATQEPAQEEPTPVEPAAAEPSPTPVAASPYYLLPTGEKTGEENPRDVFAIKTIQTPSGDTGSFAVMDKDGKPEPLVIAAPDGVWRHPDVFIASDVDHPKHPKHHETRLKRAVDAFNNPANAGVVFDANLGPDVSQVRVVTAEELQNRKIEAVQNLQNIAEEFLNKNKGSVLDETFKIGTTVGKVPTHSVFEQTLRIDGADIDVAYIQKTDRKTGEKKIHVMSMMDESGLLMIVNGFDIKLSPNKRTPQAEPVAAPVSEQVTEPAAPPVVEAKATTPAPKDIIQANAPAPDSLAAAQQTAAEGPAATKQESVQKLVLTEEDRVLPLVPPNAAPPREEGDGIMEFMRKVRAAGNKGPEQTGPA